VGPETGSRTFDKIDFILLPIVLILQVFPLVLGLIPFSMKLILRIYNYLFAQGLVAGTTKFFQRYSSSSTFPCTLPSSRWFVSKLYFNSSYYSHFFSGKAYVSGQYSTINCFVQEPAVV
jgi:hypothetical protein